jgi:hypothetical protein
MRLILGRSQNPAIILPDAEDLAIQECIAGSLSLMDSVVLL